MDSCFTKKETDNRESRSEESSADRTTLWDRRQGSRNLREEFLYATFLLSDREEQQLLGTFYFSQLRLT